MLTPELKTYISDYNGMGIGTVDNHLMPEFQRALGAVAIDDERIKIIIDEPSAGKTFHNLSQNGRVSVIMVSLTNMESFQFKGYCSQWGKIAEADVPIFNNYMAEFDKLATTFGFGNGMVYNYPHSSLSTLIIEVKEVFEQTPRAGTGGKIL
jgi:hypothetical protein